MVCLAEMFLQLVLAWEAIVAFTITLLNGAVPELWIWHMFTLAVSLQIIVSSKSFGMALWPETHIFAVASHKISICST